MANLKVNVAGVEFPNPVIVGSASPSMDWIGVKKGIEGGSGGVIVKSLFGEKGKLGRNFPRPRFKLYDYKTYPGYPQSLPHAFTLNSLEECSHFGYQEYMEDVNRAKDAVGDKGIVMASLSGVTLDEWQAILDEGEDEGRSQSSINNDAILIRALHAYAMKRDIIGKDYSRYLDIPTVDIKVKKGALNDLQLAKLEELARAGFPGASEAMVLCYTGLRISEFLSLTPFAYRSEDGGYLQCGVKSAAGRDRIIPIHPKISAYVQQWLSVEKGMSSDRYRISVFTPVVEQLGIPEATPHWCRHTFATLLSRAGVDEIKVKLLLGHSLKGNVTATYIHPTPADLAKEVKKLA